MISYDYAYDTVTDYEKLYVESENTANDARDHLEGLVDCLCKEGSFDIHDLERHLEELCHSLQVVMPGKKVLSKKVLEALLAVGAEKELEDTKAEESEFFHFAAQLMSVGNL